jgi:hypothetical protein
MKSQQPNIINPIVSVLYIILILVKLGPIVYTTN